jgi:predicted nucleic-acid-binding protein
VRAIDTNVVARLLTEDDPGQVAIAADIIAGGVFISDTVLLEVGWLLQSVYRQPREACAAALAGLLHTRSIVVEQPERLRWAVARYAAGADLADMIHLATLRGATSFATFDRAIARAAGPDAPLPVETLG